MKILLMYLIIFLKVNSTENFNQIENPAILDDIPVFDLMDMTCDCCDNSVIEGLEDLDDLIEEDEDFITEE